MGVNRLAHDHDAYPEAYMAEIRLTCADCGEPFRWTGLSAGINFRVPMTDVTGQELRAPIRPASSDPDFGLGLPSFGINLILPPEERE